ncbi:MAG: aldehyde ferredoxin oxidoreductase family protein [Spirochaetes bacterium]|nr:aldehyde ferredoxin oxidoreductase family protein [Spirochaetota bacterium]
MNGWTGTLLAIDLDDGSHRVIEPPAKLYETYLGGRCFAGHFLRPCAREPWDSPGMPLLFFTGPLTDTSAPSSARSCVMTRSPLTGTVGDASVGGDIGIHLKRAGWDGLVITGRRVRLSGIEILDREVRIRDASHLAGAPISRCMKDLPEGGSLAIIGPAAENGVRFAGIAVDGHFFAGRGGAGLVMAAKNLKYIRVAGTGRTGVRDPDELTRAGEEIHRLAAASPILKGELGISEFGTGALYDLMHSRRMMPTENFRKTLFPGAPAMNAWHYRERYATSKTGCRGCRILCKKKGRDGRAMPEFETMSHFSALVGNRDIDAVVEANRLCNDLGMDTISTAATLACYFEITGETPSPAALLDLVEDIGLSRGEGSALKEGSRRYGAAHGREDLSMSVKGLELAAYDPRGAYGMALAYAVSTRGACHLRAYPIAHEILRKPVATDRFSFSGKARIIKISEDTNAAADSLTACRFLFLAASLEEYARAAAAVTGVPFTAQDLMRIGERASCQERIINAANGFTAADDVLPERFFTEAGSGGEGIEIPPLDREEFHAALAAYYRVRGLDEKGMPTEETIRGLGLE